MTDIFTKQKRSDIMSRIRAKNTKPEILVRRFLFSQGFRFRLYQKNLPGSPDIVLKKHKTVIVINGCFWHGHDNCPIFKMPKTRVKFWASKIERNKARDISERKSLKKLGWKIITVWECQLRKKKLEKTLTSIISKIGS